MASRRPPNVAALQFHHAMLDGCHTLKALGYWPAYFHREVANQGGVATVGALLDRSGTSDGFAKLWSLRRLDLSAEAFALLPWYRGLFTEEQLDRAQRRLEDHGFDVGEFVERESRTPPRWWQPEHNASE